MGCHLLYRHKQLQQQKHPGGTQLAAELCRILQNQQQWPQAKELISLALSDLLRRGSSVQQGLQLLCLLAEELFPAQQQRQLQGKGPRRKQQQQQEAGDETNVTAAKAAAGAAATAGGDVLHLLDLLSSVMDAEHAQPRAAGAAADPGGSCFNRMPLLAAAMLPSLMPASVMANPGARKLWLSVAATAALAAPPPTAVAAAAAAMGGSSGHAAAASEAETIAVPHDAAAAAVQAHCAGLEVLAAAARGDKDANVRAKALSLLVDAVPCIWQQLAFCGILEQQQHGGVAGASAQGSDARVTLACSSSDSRQQLTSSLAAMTAALQSQLTGSSKSCRGKALQLLQLILSDPAAALDSNTLQTKSSCIINPAHPLLHQQVTQWQQQVVVDTYPYISALLSAPEDSPCTALQAQQQHSSCFRVWHSCCSLNRPCSWL